MKPNCTAVDDVVQGVTLIMAAVFLLALADALVKYLSASLSLWQLFVLASLVSLPTLMGLILVCGGPHRLGIISPLWVGTRSLLLLLMWIAYYAALPLIPLSVAAVAIYTTPLLIAVLASWAMREPLSLKAWCGILLGFVGVVVVLRPSSDAFSPAVLLPVVAAFFYALAMVATRHHCQREHPLVLALGLNLAFLMVGSLASVAVSVTQVTRLAEQAPFLLSAWQPLDSRELICVVVYALLLVAVNTGVARAYQVAPSALIGTFDYAYLIFASLWGYLLFQEVPDAMTCLGMGMILVAGILVLRRHRA